jgi:hypothetical protein
LGERYDVTTTITSEAVCQYLAAYELDAAGWCVLLMPWAPDETPATLALGPLEQAQG